jgi:hypothetical protein
MVAKLKSNCKLSMSEFALLIDTLKGPCVSQKNQLTHYNNFIGDGVCGVLCFLISINKSLSTKNPYLWCMINI